MELKRKEVRYLTGLMVHKEIKMKRLVSHMIVRCDVVTHQSLVSFESRHPECLER